MGFAAEVLVSQEFRVLCLRELQESMAISPCLQGIPTNMQKVRFPAGILPSVHVVELPARELQLFFNREPLQNPGDVSLPHL